MTSTEWRQRDAAALQEILRVLQESPSAAPLLDELVRDKVRIRVVEDATFFEDKTHSTRGTYGNYTMTLPRSHVHGDVYRAAKTVIHEAQHHHDSGWGWGAKSAASGVIGALDAVVELRNPIDGFQAGVLEVADEGEVRAYQLDGTVLGELGVDTPSHGRTNGEVASAESIRSMLAESSTYNEDKKQAEIAERPPGSRPPTDTEGAFDGPTSTLRFARRNDELDVRRWRMPDVSTAALQAAPIGVAATGALLLLGRNNIRAAAPVAAIMGALATGAVTFGITMTRTFH